MRHIRFVRLLSLIVLASAGWASEPLVKSGEVIAFLGDSITQQGAGAPSGYVNLVVSGLKANAIAVTAVPAGISGNKSDQMLERLQRDVLSKKPAWMTLSCGVNDVWHGAKGIPLDQYKRNITAILDQAQAAGVKVVVLTATMIMEDPANPLNKSLIPYNEFLRGLAAERKLPIADLNADMQARIEAAGEARKRGNLLTVDGVHMNPVGNQMMAIGVLRAFGLDAAQVAKATEAWQDIPKAITLTPKLALTFRQYGQLQEAAAKQGRTVGDLLDDLLAKAAAEILTSPAKP